MRHALCLVACLAALAAQAQITERERPAEWADLIEGARFMDRFLPMPDGTLTYDTWGAPGVIPRYTDNGIESPDLSFWGGNILKGDDGRYHMYVCGWDEKTPKGHSYWPKSTVYHAVAQNLHGPYTVADTIGKGHNPEVFRLDDGRLVLYVIKGYYIADGYDGPWEYRQFDFDTRERPIIDDLSNLTFARRPDGSRLMICRGGGTWISRDGLSTYRQISDRRAYPDVDGRFEDPLVWRDSIQYHLIVNDWLGRIAFYERSLDGVNWVVEQGEAYVPGISRHSDGRIEDWFKYERIKVFQDEYGRAVQMNFAVIDTLKAEDRGGDNHSSKNICIPLRKDLLLEILNTEPIDANTGRIELLIKAEPGFDPARALDVQSLRLGSYNEVNFGRGSKPLTWKKRGNDLLVTFDGHGSGIDAAEFAPKLIGRDTKGQPVVGYAALPYVNYRPAILSPLKPKYDDTSRAWTVEVENFGLSDSDPSTVTITNNGMEVATGMLPALKPYEKHVVSMPGANNIEDPALLKVRITPATTTSAAACHAPAQQVRVSFVTPSIVRVQRSIGNSQQSIVNPQQSIVNPQQSTVEVTYSETPTSWRYTSSDVIVDIDKVTSAVKFTDIATGRVTLHELDRMPMECEPVVQERIIYDDNSARMEDTANGKVTVKDIVRRDTIGTGTRFRLNFAAPGEQALYGLGSHMEDYMNLVGKTMYLTQHNLKIHIPVLSSTNGYGLLFDAGCAMKFEPCDAPENENGYTLQLESAPEAVYYYINAPKLDDVVAGYRLLTGNVSLPPRYLFGYIQSKERYVSSDDLIRTLSEYRRRHVPVDMIVQDWNYWPEGWGYMKMNTRDYPDPKALADSIHALNGKLMVSIWPNPQYCPEERDFRDRGFMLEHSVYDAFNPDARALYWKYANDEFFSRGFDAWWCDSSEPLDGDWNQLPPPVDGKPYSWDDHERRWHLNADILSDALGADRSSMYALYHALGIYENQRATYTPDIQGTPAEKRVVNLTRSAYPGSQSLGTVVWNGDTYASWQSFKRQIPSGLNYMATGNPYWTVDIGGFFTGADGRWFRKGEFPEGVASDGYREFYTRMFQWATFLPILRSHGSDTPREIWRFGEPGTLHYDAILDMINMRYAMNPYIYSLAAMQTFGDYTMARPLAFDFAHDPAVLDIRDQYMFGDMLVCPVTDPGVASRRVYLPSGTDWHDYWTGAVLPGGTWIDAPTPIDRLPLYVRAGAIIPTTEVTEYIAAQAGKPVTINVYPGADARFTLYDDEGDNYNYERGLTSTIDIAWDQARSILTLEPRCGEYPGMQQVRTFVIKTPKGSKTVKYKGKRTTVKI